MKILYIDPVSSVGHLNFNRIYINALLVEANIDFVFRGGYIEKLGYDKADLKYVIPEWMYIHSKSKVINRLYMLLQLLCIKFKFSFKQYDYIFISYYEEISFYLSGIKAPNLFLINHRNVVGLGSCIKSFFLKKISRKILGHIVFEEYMRNYFYKSGIKNVEVVSHGLPPSYLLNSASESILNSLIPDNLQFNHIVFSPSSSSVDVEFVDKLINNNSFCSFLEENKILLIIKGNYKGENKRNFLILNDYITQIQYETLFLRSDFILICYPSTFDYCVSAVLFECFSNNVPCLLSDIRALRCFSKQLNYNCYYNDVVQLEHLISCLIENPPTQFYKSLNQLQPDFKFLSAVNL